MAHGVSAHSDGSSIVTGSFRGSAIFGVHTLNNDSLVTDDVFVAKVSPSGEWLWALRVGGTGSDVGMSVAVASDGTASVVGYFESSAVFGSTTLSSTGGTADIFLAKVSANGQWVWAVKAGGSATDWGTSVAMFSDGSSMITGIIGGSATFGSTTLSPTGGWSTFVAKVSSSGVWVWANNASGSDNQGYSVAILSDGSAVIAGHLRGAVSFGSTDVVAPNRLNMYVAKVSSSGRWVYATRAGGTGNTSGEAVAVLSEGSTIIVGDFTGEATFGSTVLQSEGYSDVFIARASSGGLFQ
jgi:hypothetical protein